MQSKSSLICPTCGSVVQRPSGLRRTFLCQVCSSELKLDDSEALKCVFGLELIAVVVVMLVTFKVGVVIAVLALMFGIVVYVSKLRQAPVIIITKPDGRA